MYSKTILPPLKKNLLIYLQGRVRKSNLPLAVHFPEARSFSRHPVWVERLWSAAFPGASVGGRSERSGRNMNGALREVT